MADSDAILDPDLPICDPHHHLWDFAAHGRYMLPDLLEDLGAGHNIESTVFIEAGAFYRTHGPDAERFVGETEFAAGVAAMAESGRYGPTRICEAIVGRADLTQGAAVERVLEQHVRAGGGRFRGVRHVGAWDPAFAPAHTNAPQGLYAQADFRRGFARLSRFGLSFEAWQYFTQLDDVAALARAFPETLIVLNHAGGPLGAGPYAGRRDEVFAAWNKGLRELAQSPNVWVKLGGLGMPRSGFDFHDRKTPAPSSEVADAWRPWIETCIDAFGPERAMFESNFPVDRISCSYRTVWNAFKHIAAGASAPEKALLFRDAARRFYRLD